jgi:Flp pilus assembly protein TadG
MMKKTQPLNSPERQRGQAIILIAMGFIILLGFTGLVVDVARVFVARGSLRRAVDSAGLAAAAQFRQNAAVSDIEQSAEQFIYAHGIVADTQTFYDMAVVTSTIRVEVCATAVIPNDPTLCTHPLQRKLVRVKAEADVSMTFLQMLGVRTTRIGAESLAEAAAVDVVIVLDNSLAMAYDPPSMGAYNNRPDLGCGPEGFRSLPGLPDDPSKSYALHTMECAMKCNDDPNGPSCYPFQKVKGAAKDFIDNLYPEYDRVAVVSLERQPQVIIPMTLDLGAAKNAIDAMRVTDHILQYSSTPGEPCPYTIPKDIDPTWYQPWKCTSSNLGRALLAASAQFATPPFRDDSLWVVIALGSGGADATDGFVTVDPDTEIYGFCPPKDGPVGPNTKNNLPYCRDKQWATHNISTSVAYDAKDYAYDKATYLGLAPGKSVPGHVPGGGLGVTMFSIGLGKKVVCDGGDTGYDGTTNPVTCVPSAGNLFIDPDSGKPDGAESLLRYIAYIGSTNDPAQPDPCAGAGLGQQCGNYYFAPDADGLRNIFLAIAGKIFTRLSG